MATKAAAQLFILHKESIFLYTVTAPKKKKNVWVKFVNHNYIYILWYDIYLTAIGLKPGGSITRHIYNKQYTQYIES